MPGGSLAGEATAYFLIAFLASNGAQVLGPEGVTLGSPATAQALRFLRSLVEEGLVPLDVVGYEWNETIRLLAEGHAALSFGGSYEGEALAEALGRASPRGLGPLRIRARACRAAGHAGERRGRDDVRRLPPGRSAGAGHAPARERRRAGDARPLRALERPHALAALGHRARRARRALPVHARRSSSRTPASRPWLPSYPRVSAQLQAMLEAVADRSARPRRGSAANGGDDRGDHRPSRWWRSRSPSRSPPPSDRVRATMGHREALIEQARAVLAGNDMGAFVRPGRDLYPHQWNWDSALIAIGLARVDPARARAEVRSLLRGQWRDGMVPHIVFHVPNPDYSPGPELWGSAACEGAPDVATSGITQPPVLATAVRVLHEADPDPGFLEEVVPALERWHEWLHATRTNEEGLVAILHPWEGADNSPRFDAALARVEVDESIAIERTDRRVVAADERPTTSDYVRYRLSRRASPRARIPARLARGRAVRLRRPDLQLDPRDGRGGPGCALGRARRERGSRT